MQSGAREDAEIAVARLFVNRKIVMIDDTKDKSEVFKERLAAIVKYLNIPDLTFVDFLAYMLICGSIFFNLILLSIFL